MELSPAPRKPMPLPPRLAVNPTPLEGFENPRINVMALRTLECPIFKTFLGGCDAHYFHFRRAFWASCHQVSSPVLGGHIGTIS